MSGFARHELVDVLSELREAGADFVSSDAYAAAAPAFHDAALLDGDGGRVPHILKHPVHGHAGAAIELARIEAEAGIKAVFCVLHRHPLSRGRFAEGDGWAGARELESLGHEVALHVDPFRLVLDGQAVDEAVGAAAEGLREHGVTVRAADTHGKGAERGAGASPYAFFAEAGDDAGSMPARFIAHAGSYSLAVIARRFGVRHWLDPHGFADGRSLRATFSVQNRRGALVAASHRPDFPVVRSEGFDLGPVVRRCLRDSIVRGSCMWRLDPDAFGRP